MLLHNQTSPTSFHRRSPSLTVCRTSPPPQITGSLCLSPSRSQSLSLSLSNPNKPNKNGKIRRRRVLVQDSGDWGLRGRKIKLALAICERQVRFALKSHNGNRVQTQVMELDGKEIKAQVWDTVGQERFRAVTSVYYRGAVGALVVYDITRQTTFDSILRWLDELKIAAVNLNLCLNNHFGCFNDFEIETPSSGFFWILVNYED
ncbi:hypothetical protein ACSBR1_035344 [Camellia fascicularis]